jgi:hypothetical protein
MLTNTSTHSFPFAMVPNTSSMEFFLVEERSLVRRKSLLLHVTDGRVRVWRQPNTAYAVRNIVEAVPFGGGSLVVWGCVAYVCKLDPFTVRSNLNGPIYRQNILDASVVAHFDNHSLNTRPVFMEDNARPHRARVVIDYLGDESITTLPWHARSPDINPRSRTSGILSVVEWKKEHRRFKL